MNACICPSSIAYFVFGVIAALVLVAIAWALADRATPRWLTPADPLLGECATELRLAHYREKVRASGLHRDPEFRLRQIAGRQFQNGLTFLPIPWHRALVPCGVVDHHERHPLFLT